MRQTRFAYRKLQYWFSSKEVNIFFWINGTDFLLTVIKSMRIWNSIYQCCQKYVDLKTTALEIPYNEKLEHRRPLCIESERDPLHILLVAMRWYAHYMMFPNSRAWRANHKSLGMRKLFLKWMRVCSHPTKNNNVSRIQSAVWICSSKVKRIFCIVFCLSTILRNVKPLTATITWHYWIDWAQKSRKNGLTCKRKKCCSTKKMHRATSPCKRWSNWMN